MMTKTREEKMATQLKKNIADNADSMRGMKKFCSSHVKNCSKCFQRFIQEVLTLKYKIEDGIIN